MFLTPVIYPVSLAPEKYRWILGLNPMSGIIDSARAVVFGTGNVDWSLFLVSMISMLVYFIMGYIYFKKTERYFADVI